MQAPGGPDVSMRYSDARVCEKNWYEDRFQEQVASTTYGKTLKELPTQERVLCRDFAPGEAGEFMTTKRAADISAQTTAPTAAVKKPSMYSAASMEERLQTYGAMPKSLQYTHGPNAVTEAARPVPHLLETTNQHFFEKMPAEATTRDPSYFAPTDRTFAKTGALEKEVKDMGKSLSEDPDKGGKGQRGEVTRRPGESGNPYGVSVFVDEYAKWGTALKGMPLDETVKKMQTKYF